MPDEALAVLALPDLRTLVLLLGAAPVLEELVFRGGLQEQLLLARVSPMAANALTAVAFALGHGLTRSWWLAAGVLLPAWALGALYQRERRLAPCVAAHAAMNLVWIGLGTATGLGAAVAATSAS